MKYERKCPDCKKVHVYKHKSSFTAAKKKRSRCKSCRQVGDRNTRHWKGKTFSDDYRKKLREGMLNCLEKRGCATCHNPLATHVFNRLNERLGFNGQHAGNGGEKRIAGYAVDYFAEIEGCPVVIEWDEKHHSKPSILKVDRVRQFRIEQALGPCIILRLNQETLDWRELN